MSKLKPWADASEYRKMHNLKSENARLKAEVERLRKAVMHSPAAQLKLKELEGKTTYEEINAAKDGKPTE